MSRQKLYYPIPLQALSLLPKMPDNPKDLYLNLCFRANFKTGICYPSYRTIMKDTGISNGKRLHEAIEYLMERGFIASWLNGHRRYYRVKQQIR